MSEVALTGAERETLARAIYGIADLRTRLSHVEAERDALAARLAAADRDTALREALDKLFNDSMGYFRLDFDPDNSKDTGHWVVDSSVDLTHAEAQAVHEFMLSPNNKENNN